MTRRSGLFPWGLERKRTGVEVLLRTEGGRLRVLWRIVLFLVLTAAFATLAALVLPAGMAGGSAATLVGAVGAGVAVLALDDRAPGALGFYLARSVPGEALRGLALGVGVAGAVVVVLGLFGGARWTSQAGSVGGWSVSALRAMALFALPAAAEEALLRGYPFQALAEVWGAGWALALTAVVFGALHLSNPGITTLGAVNVAAAGLFLGALQLRTGSLWWASGAHLGWNWTLGFLADLKVSGLDVVDAPLLQGVSSGPSWLGGGTFGPEGSVVATVAFLGAAAACWWGRWLVPSRAALAAGPLAVVRRDETNERLLSRGAAAPQPGAEERIKERNE